MMDCPVGGFGDLRLEKGGCGCCARWWSNLGYVRKLGHSRAGEMQIHRLLRNRKVTVDKLAGQAGLRTGQLAQGLDVIVIQDTCEISVPESQSHQCAGSRPRGVWPGGSRWCGAWDCFRASENRSRCRQSVAICWALPLAELTCRGVVPRGSRHIPRSYPP